MLFIINQKCILCDLKFLLNLKYTKCSTNIFMRSKAHIMLIIYLVDYKRYWEFCQHDEYCNEGLPNNLCGSMINFFVCIAGLSLMGTNVHKYIVDYQLTVDVYSLTPYHKFFIYQFKCLIRFEQCNNCQLTMHHCKNNN